MSKNLDNVSPHYEELEGVAGADLVAGNIITTGELNHFPLVDVTDGEKYASVFKSPKVIAKKAVGVITFGSAVYWKNASKDIGEAGDILIGYAVESALSADAYCTIAFDGSLAFAVTDEPA